MRRELAIEMAVFDGDIKRANLAFEVPMVNHAEKLARVHEVLTERLASGSAIVYRATRDATETVADYLQRQGWDAAAFHAGLAPPAKRQVQDGFIDGSIRVICATNAFGMGIDKADVRLVIHADIPGSEPVAASFDSDDRQADTKVRTAIAWLERAGFVERDQNIYQFRGANVAFIRRFAEDYQAETRYLVENHRSSAHIIAAANDLIVHNRDRMKGGYPIRINRDRKALEPGGRWQRLDPLGRGRVQVGRGGRLPPGGGGRGGGAAPAPSRSGSALGPLRRACPRVDGPQPDPRPVRGRRHPGLPGRAARPAAATLPGARAPPPPRSPARARR
jgi:hypothetical protein